MRLFLYCFLILSAPLFSAEKLPDVTPIASKLPLSFDDSQIQKDYSPYVTHPWVRRQPDVTTLNFGLIEDLLSIEFLLEKFPLPDAFGDPLEFLIGERVKLTKTLDLFAFHFPNEAYHTLYLPATPLSTFPTPKPFRLFDRIYLGQSKIGIPMYVEARVFELSEAEGDFEEEEILEWHFNLLLGGQSRFSPIEGKSAYLGFGKRNTSHFDPSHGFSTQDRGVFFAARRQGKTLCLLFADLPKDEMTEQAEYLKSFL